MWRLFVRGGGCEVRWIFYGEPGGGLIDRWVRSSGIQGSGDGNGDGNGNVRAGLYGTCK